MTCWGWLAGALAVILLPIVLHIGTSHFVWWSLTAHGASALGTPALAGWSRWPAEHAGPAEIASPARPEPAAPQPEVAALPPEQAPIAAPVATPATAPAQGPAQGADLAARARFVATTFAFPEADLAPDGSGSGPTGWPLHMTCQPTRFTLTLRHAALAYRLEFCNRGAEVLEPLIIRADLNAATSRLTQTLQTEFAGDALPVCHYLDRLPAGETIAVTGELRLPLGAIAVMRLGTAELLVPLIRVCAESAGEARPALTVSAGFAIGLPPLCPGGGIQPFRLDAGPGIWRKLTARRLVHPDFR